MKIFPNKNRLAWLAVALSCTVLLMIPLITGAVPNLDPPNGTTVPTFNGLNINDGTTNNFNIGNTGNVSNLTSGPVRFADDQGVHFGNAKEETGLFVNADGNLSNPKTSNDPNPDCYNNRGLNTSGVCDYSILISDYGGLRVRSDEPNTPPGWFFVDTRINGNGIDIYSQNRKALNVHADSEVVGLYTTDFNITSSGIKTHVQDTDGGSYMTGKGFDATTLDNFKIYSNSADSYPEPSMPSTWRRGALVNLDAWQSVLTLGAQKLSLGNYSALAFGGEPIFTETAYIDNTTSPVTMEVKGHLKASGGIGTYSTGTTSASANADSPKYFTAACPSGYKVISCGYSWPTYRKTLDLVWMYPSTDKCVYNFWNHDTAARSLTGYVTCYNDKV